jgi:hypothetical protein
MRRRAVFTILAGLAVACAATAVILGPRIAGEAAQRPLGGQETATLTAAGASYLSPATLKEVTGADIEVTLTITPVASTDYPALAIWDVRTSTVDTTSRQQLEPTSRTVVFDRRTAELANCCGGSINGDAFIPQEGIAGWAFPVGTRPQTYNVFDPALDSQQPVRYAGTETIDGIRAYRFSEDVSGAKAGFTPLSSADPELYSMHRVYWVDPETGMLINLTENEDLSLVHPTTGSVVTHLFRGDLHATPATVARLTRQDASIRDKIALMVTARRALFGLACGLALVACCLLVRWPGIKLPRRPRRHDPRLVSEH